ncbi:MAG TPA: Uma2 family endonuclease [Solirubrobacteraceae bacterium]|jgi:Uma2 family endonuclease|nr:Uma2 family endonuclease [Solirubrobacteraceae bacterium]
MATQIEPAALHRLDTETYNRIVESGALDGQPVELIDGLLVEHMSPQGPAHSALIERLTRHLAHAQSWLRVQLPLEVPPDSEPEPDLALVESESSPERHVRSALLAVEVSVSTHKLDRGSKAALYARAEVPVYWVVDATARAVEVYTQPQGDGYRDRAVYGVGELVPSPAAGVAELDLAALFAGVGD